MQFRGVRLWLLAFAAFFLMIGGWALAAPYDGSADEHDHIYRAVGIWNGDLAPEPANAVRGSGAFVRVPRGLVVPDEPCWQFKPGMPASCAPEPSSDATTVRVGTGAGRYHPGYYAVVGVPLKLWPGWSGVLLARLLTGAGAAALLAAAVVTIVTYFRRRYMLAGLLVAVTPMALHFFGAVNPNGLEIAAGVGLFTALIPLVLGRLDTVPKGLLALAGISAVLLASLRPTGLMYLFFGAVALFVPFRREIAAAAVGVDGGPLVDRRGRARRLFERRLHGGVQGHRHGLGVPPAGARSSAARLSCTSSHYWGEWAKQLVGVFSWLDIYLPSSMYVVWHLAAGALLVFGAAFGHWIDRWRLVALVLGATGIPTFLQWWFLNHTGFVTQGRYMLPALVGVMIFAAWVLEERGLPERAGPVADPAAAGHRAADPPVQPAVGDGPLAQRPARLREDRPRVAVAAQPGLAPGRRLGAAGADAGRRPRRPGVAGLAAVGPGGHGRRRDGSRGRRPRTGRRRPRRRGTRDAPSLTPLIRCNRIEAVSGSNRRLD